MRMHRTSLDPNDIVDNVTQPNDTDAQGSNGNNPNDLNEAVDIAIDDHDPNKVFDTQPSIPLQPPPPSMSTTDAFGASLARSIGAIDAPPSPPPAYDQALQPPVDVPLPNRANLSPVETYRLLLPTALHDSGLLFNPQFTLSSLKIVRDSPKEAETASTISSASAGSGSNLETAPTPSLDQIEACKPHPDALFVAETLEWRLILDPSQIYRTSPPDSAAYDASHLFDACNLVPGFVSMFETVPTSIPAHEQCSPVRLLERCDPATQDAPLPILDEFNLHKCWITGKRLLSSPPDSIVTVIDRHVLMQFKESREQNPAVGLSGPETFVRALRVLLRIIGNFVHGERRAAPTSSATLTQKLGWDEHARQILQTLGWKEDRMPDGRNAILPPLTGSSVKKDLTQIAPITPSDSAASSGLHMILQRHIRAWIELSVWLAFHLQQLRKSNPNSTVVDSSEPSFPTRIVVESASEPVLEMIGERQDHIDPSLPTDLSTATLEALFTLGASSRTRDELVKFSYLVNLEASPTRAAELFACLDEVYSSQRRTSRLLEELLAYERNLGKYSPRDLDKAYDRLHLSALHLGPDVARDTIPIDFIVDNYKARAREVLINADAAEHAAVKGALKIITAHLGNPDRLVQLVDEDVDMDVDQAYGMLDASPELDDATILAVFDLYVADAPSRQDFLRHALRAIAEDRKSEYLRHFLRTGEKDASATEGWQQMPSADVPAGIDNIGNTCYLNSVLQYFFSITEIRSRVLQAAATVQAGADLPDSVTDEQLQGNDERRVGGQRITARELQRSRRFVAQLGELFHQLIHVNALSVRPERELAYLALVSSRAEELEAELNPITWPQDEDSTQAVSVLTSDPAEIEDAPASKSAAETDLMDTTPDQVAASQAATQAGSAAAPPLPPRPPRKATEAAIPPPARRNSLMQLGAQQDVSECLDNCMFQLEVALAISKQAKALANPENHMDVDGNESLSNADGNEDLLTNLFLGKTCQRIEADNLAPGVVAQQSNGDTSGRPAPPQKEPSTHVKHEVFKILPIDVLEEGRDIYDGFDGFFDSDTFVATSGQVQRRSVTLLCAPPLLQIQLQRVQYDRITMRAFKSQAHLEMPETLHVDRYMDLDPSDASNAERVAKRLDYQAKRRRIEELRAKLAACKDGANFHLTQTLSQAANAVEELARLPPLADHAAQLVEIQAESTQSGEEAVPLPPSPRTQAKQAASQPDEGASNSAGADTGAQGAGTNGTATACTDETLPPAFSSLIDPGLGTMLRDEAKLLREQVKHAKEEIEMLKAEMGSIWADEQRYAYRLVAVFMHRGEASHGHYFLNLRGGGQDSKWFKYNDSAVTPTTLDQVLRDRSGATPYLVTYVREDYVRLIDPICRQLVTGVGLGAGTEMEQAEVAKDIEGWEQTSSQAGRAQDEVVEVGKPCIVTDATAASAGDAGTSSESPVKRARTDDL